MSVPTPDDLLKGAKALEEQRAALEAAVANDACLMATAKALLRVAGTAFGPHVAVAANAAAEVARIAINLAARSA